jgi:PTH2 family peptidyl-tRNA hydrolase
MIKQVIVMRKDLGMRKGKMIAQGAHASMKVFLDRGQRSSRTILGRPYDHKIEISLTDEMKEWVEGLFTKVCVSVDSEDELLAIVKKADIAGLPNALIQDAGRTEFDGVPTYTCCAIGPAKAEEIDKITGDLKLL